MRHLTRSPARLHQKSVLLFCSYFVISLLEAQPNATNIDGTLLSYLRGAIEGNPHRIALEAKYEAVKSKIPQAASLPDPTFQVTQFVESVQTRTGPQERIFVLSQRIPWFGKLKTREAQATAEAKAAWYSWQNHLLMLAKQTSLEFFEYGFTCESIRLTEDIRKLLQQLEPIVEQKVSVGGNLNSLLRLKVEIGKVEDQLLSLKQKRLQQSAELVRLFGWVHPELLPLPVWEAPEAISPDGNQLAAGMTQSNPELQMLLLHVDALGSAEELARLSKYPDVSVGLNYVDLGDRIPGSSLDRENPWGVTLSVNIPIWKEKIEAQQTEAKSNKIVAVHHYHERYIALSTELAVSLLAHEDGQRRLKLYGKELLDLAKQAVQNSRASYENDKATILEVIDSERSLLDLQLLYWRAVADVWKQRVTMQTLANQPILGKFKATQEEKP